MSRKMSTVSVVSVSTASTLDRPSPGLEKLASDSGMNDIEAGNVPSPLPVPEKHTSDASNGTIPSSQSKDSGGFGRIGIFTVNIVAGIIGSQLASGMMPHNVYHVWYEVVSTLSLLCLAFIMINVGYEFNLDKSNLRLYGTDTLVAMTAAGFPWIFVACWFIWALPNPLPWDQALVAARFAAPTSAGVLFCMLEAAGLKETWLFKKARILAIFDDLDTILFMVPLKAILVGLKWELFLILAIVFGLLILGYRYLHTFQLPTGWRWTMMYALVITSLTEVVYYITHHHITMEAIHIEVLLPAFILGVVIRVDHNEEDQKAEHQHTAAPAEAKLALAHLQDERFLTYISALFMVLVGLSMPPLFGGDSTDSNNEPISAGAFVGHVVAVSLLMVLGKMFPVACYKQEANFRTRFALAMGMCPRGEVGAGVILISLDLGIKGEAIGIAVVCLALNMVLTGGFIVSVKWLVTSCVDKTHQVGTKLMQVVPAPDSELGDGIADHNPKNDSIHEISADKDSAPKVLSITGQRQNDFKSPRGGA